VGERESGTSMVHLEILTVKPVPELAASEIVLKVSFVSKQLFSFFNTFAGYSSPDSFACRPGCFGIYESILRVQR